MSLFLYFIKNKVMIMFSYVNRQALVWVFFVWIFASQHVSLRKSAPEIVVKFLVFFTFSINFFMKTLIKNIVSICQTVSLDHLLMYLAKVVCQASLPSFLTWVSLVIFCLEKCQMEVICSALHHCYWWER